MNIRQLFFLVASAAIMSAFPVASYAQLLSGATVIQSDFEANDIVYDRFRDVIYATVGSDAGLPNGNSLLTLDPNTLSIRSQVSIGSEPEQLAISNDGSRVYVGIDGATSVLSFSPDNGAISDLLPVRDRTSPAIAEDLLVSSFSPNRVIVSADEIGSSGSGDLQLFEDEVGLINAVSIFPNPRSANSLAFADQTTLITYNDSDTGFGLARFAFDGFNFTLEDTIGGLVRGFGTDIESSGGLIFATTGIVVDPETLTSLGTFSGSGALESNAFDQTTYFLDLGGELSIFDNATFLEIDSIELDDVRFTSELISLGNDRLGFVSTSGEIGVISNIPFTAVPEPSSGMVLLVSSVVVVTNRRRRI